MAREKNYPSDKQDQFMIRLPDGMRDRISESANRNGRSMNAEIVQALEQFFPSEPPIEEIFDKVHLAIEMAETADSLPYRRALVEALDQLSERLATGLEFDQFQSRTLAPNAAQSGKTIKQIRRWQRARELGVEQADLERELEQGLLRSVGRSRAKAAIDYFANGEPEHALRVFRLDTVKFQDRDGAYRTIESFMRKYYENNWGDPDEPAEFIE